MSWEWREEAVSSIATDERSRDELYEEFGINEIEARLILLINIAFSLIVNRLNLKEDYEISSESQILAEIALLEAYKREPTYGLLLKSGLVIGLYDILHPLPSEIYGLLLVAVATVNGLTSRLRSPKMVAAEIKSETDEMGVPADIRLKATNIASTSITIVLLTIAVLVQVLISGQVIGSELLNQNYAVGTLAKPWLSALLVILIPYLLDKIR
jgi:hypothetical protein